MILTATLIVMVGKWNEYVWPLIVTSTADMRTAAHRPAVPPQPGGLQQLGRDHRRRRVRLPPDAHPLLPGPEAHHRRPRRRSPEVIAGHARARPLPQPPTSRPDLPTADPMTTPRPSPNRTTLQGAPRMSRHLSSPSRRSLLAALGLRSRRRQPRRPAVPRTAAATTPRAMSATASRRRITAVPAGYEGRTAILFWAPWTGELYESLMTLLTEFNESQDEIVAIAESVGGYADLTQKFTAALQARAVPDIVCFPEMQWLQFHASDALAPLDGYFDDEWNTDIYIPNYVNEGIAAGETFVVPSPAPRRCSTSTARSTATQAFPRRAPRPGRTSRSSPPSWRRSRSRAARCPRWRSRPTPGRARPISGASAERMRTRTSRSRSTTRPAPSGSSGSASSSTTTASATSPRMPGPTSRPA